MEQNKSGWKTLLIVIATILVVAIVLGAAGVFWFYNSPEGAVIRFCTAAFKETDAEKVVACLPEAFLELLEDEADVDRDDLIDNFEERLDETEDSFDDMADEWDLGDDVKVSIRFFGIRKLTEDELEECQEYFKDECDIEIEDVREYWVGVVLKGDESKYTETVTLQAVKIDGKWSVMFTDF